MYVSSAFSLEAFKESIKKAAAINIVAVMAPTGRVYEHLCTYLPLHLALQGKLEKAAAATYIIAIMPASCKFRRRI